MLWGAVPDIVAAVEVGALDPVRLDTVAGPAAFGDIRFVLGTFEDLDPSRAPVTYLDATGRALWVDWPSTIDPGSSTPACFR